MRTPARAMVEANLIIRDHNFNRQLHEKLDRLLQEDCRRIPLERIVRGYWWRAPLAFVIFHFLRHFPQLVGLFPAHRPKLQLIDPEPLESESAPLQRDHR